MSEEENKEYEELKSLLYQGNLTQYGKRKLIEIIEKQQKQIEELKNEIMEKELIIDGMKEDRRIAVEEIQEQYYVSKDKIKAKIEEIKKYKDLARDSIEERIVIAHSDSLNYGRKEAHEKDIEVLQTLL